MSRSLFMPRLMDEDNFNPQNKNAQLLLCHWPQSDWEITALTYNAPDKRVAIREKINIIRLWRWRGWYLHLFLRYLRPYDLVFYPGVHVADAMGLRWRRRLGFSAPLVVTLEGLVGNEEREKEYTAWAGHKVYCQYVPPDVLRRVDEMLFSADHVIAISPFLARMGRRRYGDKFSVLPLGIDTSVFYPPRDRQPGRLKVVSAGRVESHKRPEVFLSLAEQYPEADFIWYGEGSLTGPLTSEARKRGLKNVIFPGSKPPNQLAGAFREADIFVLPSLSEGVPKVTQEAAACGLPVVLFGHYEAPSVKDGHNGFVVWDDETFMEKVGELLDNPILVESFGRAGAEMSQGWAWDVIAPQWEDVCSRFVLGENSD